MLFSFFESNIKNLDLIFTKFRNITVGKFAKKLCNTVTLRSRDGVGRSGSHAGQVPFGIVE